MKLNCETQDRYTPDVNEVPPGEVVNCGVCGDAMNERRNVLGPRGYASALAGSKSLHDEFECPNRESDWHVQIVKLRRKIEETPSSKIADLLKTEVLEILDNRKATK